MKKRVCIYQDGLLAYSETFIKKQALALKEWEPILLGHKFTRNGLPLEPLQAHLLIPTKISKLRRFIYVIKRWLNIPDSIGIKTLQSLNVDLIHAHFGTSAVDIWPYAKKLNISMLVTLHGFDINIHKEWWESGKRSKRRKNYPKQLLDLAEQDNVHFIAVSSAIKKRAKDFGIPDEKISIQYIGVDVEQFSPSTIKISDRKNRIIYVGRLIEKKGLNYLIDAFAEVRKVVTDAELIVIGKGPLEATMKEKVSSHSIEGIHFLGAQSNAEVKRHLDTCKIFCLPSITAINGDAEGLPISILEAQASGVLVVSSSSGGVGDNLIDKETCFMFPEKDSKKLANILIDSLQNTERYLSILENQKILIQRKFQLSKCSIELETLYDQQVKNRECLDRP